LSGAAGGVSLASKGPPRGAPLPPRALCAWSTFGPHANRSKRSAAVTSGTRSKSGPTTSSPGCRRPSVPRETKWTVGRLRMALTGFLPTPGSRHRGSVGGHPRYGGRAAYPPVPSDSPSLGTHEGARRPALYAGTSARLALAPCAPFLATVPHMGDDPTPIGNECHPAFYIQRASRRMPVRNGWSLTSGR
jgi:hypothetical protein